MLAVHVAPPAPVVGAASTVTGAVRGSWSSSETETPVVSACATPESVSAAAVAAKEALTTVGELVMTAFVAPGRWPAPARRAADLAVLVDRALGRAGRVAQ